MKERAQKVLDDSSLGELAKWKAISKYLLEEKILYKQCIKADQLLVHPQNRGGTGGASVQLACQRKTHFGMWM